MQDSKKEDDSVFSDSDKDGIHEHSKKTLNILERTENPDVFASQMERKLVNNISYHQRPLSAPPSLSEKEKNLSRYGMDMSLVNHVDADLGDEQFSGVPNKIWHRRRPVIGRLSSFSLPEQSSGSGSEIERGFRSATQALPPSPETCEDDESNRAHFDPCAELEQATTQEDSCDGSSSAYESGDGCVFPQAGDAGLLDDDQSLRLQAAEIDPQKRHALDFPNQNAVGSTKDHGHDERLSADVASRMEELTHEKTSASSCSLQTPQNANAFPSAATRVRNHGSEPYSFNSINAGLDQEGNGYPTLHEEKSYFSDNSSDASDEAGSKSKAKAVRKWLSRTFSHLGFQKPFASSFRRNVSYRSVKSMPEKMSERWIRRSHRRTGTR